MMEIPVIRAETLPEEIIRMEEIIPARDPDLQETAADQAEQEMPEVQINQITRRTREVQINRDLQRTPGPQHSRGILLIPEQHGREQEIHREHPVEGFMIMLIMTLQPLEKERLQSLILCWSHCHLAAAV